jgi:hypothetical protein
MEDVRQYRLLTGTPGRNEVIEQISRSGGGKHFPEISQEKKRGEALAHVIMYSRTYEYRLSKICNRLVLPGQ